MHQPVSYLYLHFLFLLLINYIDCRRSVETADFIPQVLLFTLSCYQSPNWDFLLDSLSFMVHLVLPYSPEMTDDGVLGWGWWGRICHLHICSLTSALRATKFISCNLSNSLSIITNFYCFWSALDFKWRPWGVFFIDSVFCCNWWSLLIAHRWTGVGRKESVILIPQIILISSCFQSFFHIGYETWIHRCCQFFLQLWLLTEWTYLAQPVFLQESLFSDL